MESRKCSMCKTEKLLGEFYNCKKDRLGKTSRCKKCSLKSAINYKLNNKERCSETCANWRLKNKDRIRVSDQKYHLRKLGWDSSMIPTKILMLDIRKFINSK